MYVTSLLLLLLLSLKGSLDLETITDPVLREAAKSQVLNFGQTPSQIFTTEHPKRMPSQECYIPLCSKEETLEDLEIFKCASKTTVHVNEEDGAILNILEVDEKIMLVDKNYSIRQFHWDSFPLSGHYLPIHAYIHHQK